MLPALTTVHQPLREMAGTATRMLLDLASGVELLTSRIDLGTQLVVRESTARALPLNPVPPDRARTARRRGRAHRTHITPERTERTERMEDS
jgi:hypothetical protein